MNRWTALVLVGLFVSSAGCAGVAPGGPGLDGPLPSGDVPAERVHNVTVVEVVDGDTMDVRYANGSTDTIRLLGVDTPEVNTENSPAEFEGIPETADGRTWLREWGQHASEFARTELAGETVRIVVDARSDVRGSYGRLLVYVHADGVVFNRALLERGYARLYDSTFSRRGNFSDVEARARSEGVGLWGYGQDSGGTPAGEGGLVVDEINADAPGNDNENLNGEYVVFANTGNETLALGGWQVRDEAGHRFVVPDGVRLEPGERVTLYTGDGSNTETALYWHSDGAIWNNDGDTVTVTTESGDRVVSRTYR